MPNLACFAVLFALATAHGQRPPEAPDGRRGLGAGTPLSELRSLFQSRAQEDEEFVAGLFDLEAELGARLANVEALYFHRRTGELLARLFAEPRDFPALVEALEGFLEHPELVTRLRGDDARAAARLFLDARVRARQHLVRGFEGDVAAIRRGLLLLRGETDGSVRLSEDEAHAAAARVDLSAALVRARILDLEALAEGFGAPSEVEEAEVDLLLELLALEPGRESAERLIALERSLADRVQRMRSLLATTRLDASAAEVLAWRAHEDGLARAALADVRALDPARDGERPAGERPRGGDNDRRRAAWARALEGCLHDPLDRELAYEAARLSTFFGSPFDTASRYDRFLALSGIRANDDRTWRGKELGAREQEALIQVQQGPLR